MKSALLIGISNYPGMDPMPGCTNDTADIEAVLRGFGFTSITRLPDDPRNWQQVTGLSIKSSLRAAIASLSCGDELVFHFSGHGVKYPLHGVDHEGLCGIDFAWTDADSVLIDDDLSNALTGLADGARMTIVADACHSGGLQPDYSRLLSIAAAPSFRVRTYPVPDYIAAEIARLDSLQQTRTFADAVMTGNGVPTTRDAVLLSACAPEELAADTDFADGRPNGVLSYTLVQRLAAPGTNCEPAVTTRAGLQTAIEELGFGQTPQLHGRPWLFGEPLIPD